MKTMLRACAQTIPMVWTWLIAAGCPSETWETTAIECDASYTCTADVAINLDSFFGCYGDDATGEIDCGDTDIPSEISSECCRASELKAQGLISTEWCSVDMDPLVVTSNNTCCESGPVGEGVSDEDIEACCALEADPEGLWLKEVEDTLQKKCTISVRIDNEECSTDDDLVDSATTYVAEDGECEEAAQYVSSIRFAGNIDPAFSFVTLQQGTTLLFSEPITGSFAVSEDAGNPAAFVLNAPTVTYDGATYDSPRGLVEGSFHMMTSMSPPHFDVQPTGGVVTLRTFESGVETGYTPSPSHPLRGVIDVGTGTWFADYTETVGPVTVRVYLKGPLTTMP